jgi:hypothetical protein
MPSFTSNKNDVKDGIERGGLWKVAYGRELTETDAIAGAVATGVSIYSGNTAAVTAWLNNLITESIHKMEVSIAMTFTAQARDQAVQFAETVISKLLRAKIPSEEIKNLLQFQFKAGVAQFLGQNYVWIPGTDLGGLFTHGDAGGHWEPVGPHTISFCPYVGLRVNTEFPPPHPGLNIGPIDVRNDYGGTVDIRLYHPAAPSHVFNTWRLAAAQESVLSIRSGEVMNIGSDWGIQILFLNGVSSPIRTVGLLGAFDRRFAISASRIFNG